ALGAESGRRIPRLVDPALAVRPVESNVVPPDELRCELDGYSLHAATWVDADDRERLERVARYVARPALAQGRLEVRGDGNVKDKRSLRRPWRDGTRAFVFDPLTFLERLVALIPHPREHQWTYFGVLAPASPLRDAVVPRSPEPRGPTDGDDPRARAKRRSWAELLEWAFAVDVLRCPKCGGRRHRIANITNPIVARKLLLHSISSSGPARRTSRARARPPRAADAVRLRSRPPAARAEADVPRASAGWGSCCGGAPAPGPTARRLIPTGSRARDTVCTPLPGAGPRP
ncbi:MAG: transposase, partial [Planctomycetota bacterium]